MTRVIAYIDGFNLYHALDDLKQPHLKWLDLWALSHSLLRRHEQLEAVRYFSAYATWRPGAYSRHRAYVSALKHTNVDVHLAHFKKKDMKCFRCNNRWVAREEKETDVNVAAHLIADALRDRFDRAILITADSDLRGAVHLVRKECADKEVLVVAPVGRFASARDLQPKLELTKGRIRKCLLPDTLTDAHGNTVVRPKEYDPPQ